MKGEVVAIIETEVPCGRTNWLGCWRPATGVIEIKKGLSARDRACVLSHELKHSTGMNHDERITFRIDCG